MIDIYLDSVAKMRHGSENCGQMSLWPNGGVAIWRLANFVAIRRVAIWHCGQVTPTLLKFKLFIFS
jgi:hypothetical protein